MFVVEFDSLDCRGNWIVLVQPQKVNTVNSKLQFRLALFLFSAFLLSGVSFAQSFSTEARKDFPFFLGIGGYFPTITGTSNGFSPGAEIVGGFRGALDNLDIVGSARGKIFFGNDQYNSGGTFQIALASVDFMFRASALYAGPGIGVASSTASISFDNQGDETSWNNGVWHTVLSLTAGVDLTPQIFAEARWQNSADITFRGYSLAMGYRF